MNKKFKLPYIKLEKLLSALDVNRYKSGVSTFEKDLETCILSVVMNRDAQYAERGKRPDLMKVLELDAKDLGLELVNACTNCNGMSKCHK